MLCEPGKNTKLVDDLYVLILVLMEDALRDLNGP